MFDFINHTLKSQGIHPLNNSGVQKKQSVVQEKAAPAPKSEKLKESDMSFSELESLVESAIKETATNVIHESVALDDSQKLAQSSAINRATIGAQFTEQFVESTIVPIVNTVGTLSEDAKLLHTIKDPKMVRGVSLPVYEVALTLESARRGGLSEESLDFTKAVREDVDPTIMDLKGASAEANVKDGKVVDYEMNLNDLVDDDESETYDMGEEAVKEDPIKEGYDPHDVHQYEENDDEMYELEKGDEPSQEGMFEDDPDYDDLSDVEDYEGETAGDPTDGGNFPEETMPVSEGARLARFMFGEDCEDPETDYDNVEDVEDYEGETAGGPGKGAEASDEYEGDGSADEAIVESQIIIAKHILGHIFSEYGITSKAKQKAIVREAVHYVFRYGVTNLFPATSDVANLVVEQNNIAEIDGAYTAQAIIEATKPVLTPVQEESIEGKSNEYLAALAVSDDLTRDAGKGDEEADREELEEEYGIKESVMKSINFITTTSLIERTRQAFRHRLHHFNEDVKASVAADWVLVESNMSPVAEQTKDEITIRKYVTESKDLKEFFGILKEDSPVYKPSWKKSSVKNDSLTTACLFFEVVTNWTKIKRAMYNKQPLDSKFVALESMIQLNTLYENLCSAMANPQAAKRAIQNHSFRLQGLKEKVELAIKNRHK